MIIINFWKQSIFDNYQFFVILDNFDNNYLILMIMDNFDFVNKTISFRLKKMLFSAKKFTKALSLTLSLEMLISIKWEQIKIELFWTFQYGHKHFTKAKNVYKHTHTIIRTVNLISGNGKYMQTTTENKAIYADMLFSYSKFYTMLYSEKYTFFLTLSFVKFSHFIALYHLYLI